MSNTTQSSPGASQHGLLITVVSWGALVIAASATGVLGALGQHFMPGYAILVVIGIVVPTVSYFSFPSVRHAVDAIGLRRLTLFHIWRIPAGGLFLYYASSGELPLPFGLIAGVGDVLAGLGAATLLKRQATEAQLGRIHLFGFADFITAVGTGLTFTLLNDPLMVTLTTLPMAL
ncbi:MAG: permease, partial [Betaproteobacteria bacterium]|nr:permease [Betaproteobacteria bacterium]